MGNWFDRERRTAQRAKEAIGSLKPLRMTTDSLLAEIQKGGERAENIVALILYVEDLTVALTEVIGQADEIMAAQQKAMSAARQAPPSGIPMQFKKG